MRSSRAGIGVALILVSAPWAQAERLPIRIYTTADGLPHDTVNGIVQDSRGYLWICTDEGLSRYDGYSFTNYGVAEGLPGANVIDIVEERDGSYWVATLGGLTRLSMDESGVRFEERPLGTDPSSAEVRTIRRDKSGALLVGTGDGPYRVETAAPAGRRIGLPFPRQSAVDHQVNALLEDDDGGLWVATRGVGIVRLRPDGRIDRLTVADGLPANNVRALAREATGGFWAGTLEGVCLVRTSSGEPFVERSLSRRDGLPSSSVRSLLRTRSGTLWAGTDEGLAEVEAEPAPGATRVRSHTAAHDLRHPAILALAEDRDRNVWIGTQAGLAKLTHGGFSTYGPESGLDPGRRIEALFVDRRGDLRVISKTETGDRAIHRLEGERFERVDLRLPQRSGGWGWGQTVLQDSRGEWLVPTAMGIFVLSDETSPPRARVTARDGLLADEIFRLFEDSSGSIWISPPCRWDRRTGAITRFPNAPETVRKEFPSAYAEDRSAAVWIGTYGGNLLRHRAGRFDRWTKQDGLPAGRISSLHVDRRGCLWIAGDVGGVARLEDPASPAPRFERLTTAQGLSSNEVNCITEDAWGRIYLGTGRGVDRLDPRTGRIRRYTTADGLASSRVFLAARDGNGSLWFRTERELSRLDPAPDEPREAPEAVIDALRVAGVPRPVHPLGSTLLAGLVLDSTENRVEIDFSGISLAPGEVLRFQYRLEGAGGGWSPPSEKRSVDYAALSPGRYRFHVRTVTADGAIGSRAAVVAFTVLPPIWRRGWFVALLASLGAGALLQAHKMRLSRLVAIERVRTRIATDLHDDIGASLTQIALQSEVLRRELGGASPDSERRLARIGEVSRQLVDTMSDIVWAISPRRDRFHDLAQRMRRFALDTLDARGIALQFEVSDAHRDLPLPADARREVYLSFKECVTNAARHSGCRTVDVALRVAGRAVELSVRDDGTGFDAGAEGEGTGLQSLRRRVGALRGSVAIRSERGVGTSVTLSFPLK